MLKELNKLWFQARRQAAAWRRWHRKLPHNRIRRSRIRDGQGRVIGYGPPTSLAEPQLHPGFCRKVTLPSGKVEVIAKHHEIEAAYRLARYPRPRPEDVVPLPITEAEIVRMYTEHCTS